MNNLLGHNNSRNEHVPGWTVDVHTGQHDYHVWGKEDWAIRGKYFERCGQGKKWYGWKGLDNVGSINTTLIGCGNATLDFGNCGEGNVTVYKNGELLSDAGIWKNNTITFDFFDGDSIDIKEYGSGIILLNNFVQNPCPGECKIFIHIL